MCSSTETKTNYKKTKTKKKKKTLSNESLEDWKKKKPTTNHTRQGDIY